MLSMSGKKEVSGSACVCPLGAKQRLQSGELEPASTGRSLQHESAELSLDGYHISQGSASPNGKWLAVGTTESSVIILDSTKLSVKAKLNIPLANPKSELGGVECMRWAPDGKKLAVALGDGHLYIVAVSVKNVDDAKKVTLKLWKGLKHRAAPSHIQWGHDSTILKTATDLDATNVTHFVLDASNESLKHYDMESQQQFQSDSARHRWLARTLEPDKNVQHWTERPLVIGAGVAVVVGTAIGCGLFYGLGAIGDGLRQGLGAIGEGLKDTHTHFIMNIENQGAENTNY